MENPLTFALILFNILLVVFCMGSSMRNGVIIQRIIDAKHTDHCQCQNPQRQDTQCQCFNLK